MLTKKLHPLPEGRGKGGFNLQTHNNPCPAMPVASSCPTGACTSIDLLFTDIHSSSAHGDNSHEVDLDTMSELEGLALGQTVRLTDGRTAIIRFLGRTNFQTGEWVGLQLEDNSGKNDGSVNGERYFECGGVGRGMFCRPKAVTVIAQPAPPKPAAAAAGARKGGRPSSMFTSGNARSGTTNDPALGKRMSLNAPSPSPVPRMSRPSSIARVRKLPTVFRSDQFVFEWPFSDM